MEPSAKEHPDLLTRLATGDEAALAALFRDHRDKLWRMVHYRLDRRLAGRVDEDDVLQEAWLDAVRRIGSFRTDDETSVLLWLRRIVGQSLIGLHRRHLGAKMRTAGAELPLASSTTMSAYLVASLTTPSRAAMRAESNAKLIEALEAMDPVDREIVVLRHFEELRNDEAAAVLGLPESTASYRYFRALGHLKRTLDDPGESDVRP